MNQNINNQQNSNEISKSEIDLQQLVAEILLHKTMLSGTKIREVSGLISQSVELNYKSINEPITDKEIDAEIERYIKQFWPRPEHGGAVRLGFKRAVRWMQERGANVTTEPIEDEVLIHQFNKIFTNVLRDYIFESEYKKRAYEFGQDCAKIAKQYAASKLNNTIEDKWISVEDKLPEEGGRYWCYTEQQTDLGLSHFQWNCSYNETTKTFSDRYLTDGERITHWQPLPSSPLPTKPTK